MKINFDYNKTWKADEIRRFDLNLRSWARQSRLRQKLLEELDRTLPDYKHKTDYHKKTTPNRLLKALKYLIP